MAEPVMLMVDKLLQYLPNIVAALVILIIGLIIAKAVKELLIPIFGKLNVDKYLEQVGVDECNWNSGGCTFSESPTVFNTNTQIINGYKTFYNI